MVARWMQAKKLKIKRAREANRIKTPYKVDSSMFADLYGKHVRSYGILVSDADAPGGIERVVLEQSNLEKTATYNRLEVGTKLRQSLRTQSMTKWLPISIFDIKSESLFMFFSGDKAFFVFKNVHLNVKKVSRIYPLSTAKHLAEESRMYVSVRISWREESKLSDRRMP